MLSDTYLHGRSVLAVFAHPDDEAIAAGGLLAWCASLGAAVSLLCMTRGEHGQGTGDVGEMRSRELDAAARALGIGDVTLLDHEDGMLAWLDADRLQADITTAIDRYKPAVVVTFDADGVYGHPDHVAVHERTTTAVRALAAGAPALYYVTTPPGAMRAVADHAARTFQGRPGDRRPRPGRGGSAIPGSDTGCAAGGRPPTNILGVADPDAFGAAAPPPTLVVDAGRFAARKLAALACHASQFHDSALAFVGERDAPRLLGVEHYRRAAAGAAGLTFLDAFGMSPGSPAATQDVAGAAPKRRTARSDT